MTLEQAIKEIKKSKTVLASSSWKKQGFNRKMQIWLEGYSIGWKEDRRESN